jgi:hypothetical protein
MRVLMATRESPEEMSRIFTENVFRQLFLPWYSCCGRSDWALTDRRQILHEFLRNLA